MDVWINYEEWDNVSVDTDLSDSEFDKEFATLCTALLILAKEFGNGRAVQATPEALNKLAFNLGACKRKIKQRHVDMLKKHMVVVNGRFMPGKIISTMNPYELEDTDGTA
jgi:hypothetical protein